MLVPRFLICCGCCCYAQFAQRTRTIELGHAKKMIHFRNMEEMLGKAKHDLEVGVPWYPPPHPLRVPSQPWSMQPLRMQPTVVHFLCRCFPCASQALFVERVVSLLPMPGVEGSEGDLAGQLERGHRGPQEG